MLENRSIPPTRFLLPVSAVALLVGTWMWAERAHIAHMHHVQAQGSLSAGGDVPAITAPVPANCSTPLSLDEKLVLHLVPLPGERSGCRVEFRTKENPFVDGTLQDGDVITTVGRDPMTPQVALGLVHRLEMAGKTGISMTVLRNGETRDIVARVAR